MKAGKKMKCRICGIEFLASKRKKYQLCEWCVQNTGHSKNGREKLRGYLL